jgi:hypothetical protein
MITTTLEWFAPAEQLPDDEVLVLTSRGAGEVTTGYTADGDWFLDDAEYPNPAVCEPVSAPDFWAHFPAGPEA